MKKELNIAIRFTLVTTVIFGLLYPLGMTGLSRYIFPKQAAGSLIEKNGRVIGSALIGQAFASDKYFHSRPSAAGAGYDATASSPSNLAPNQSRPDRSRERRRGRSCSRKIRASRFLRILVTDFRLRPGSGNFPGRGGVSDSSRRQSTGDERRASQGARSAPHATAHLWPSGRAPRQCSGIESGS